MLLFEDHRDHAAAADQKVVVYAVAFSPDGTTLATGAKDGSLFLRDPGGVRPLLEHGPKSLAVHAIGYLPTEPGVIIGGEFGWLGYRQEGGAWRQFGPPWFPSVTSLAVLDDRTVALGTGDRLRATAGTFELWDISADRKKQPYFHEPNGVRAIAASPKKKMVAWATGHRKVRVWDITRQTPIEFPQPDPCFAVALSADATALAVAAGWTARLYDVERKRERFVLKGHTGQVSAVAFSPDGATLATGSWDHTVRLWDVASGKEKANYKWDIGRVYCLAYAPDGLRLAAGGDLGRVIVWDTE
jgi:WD40 repeat protein